jgi:polyhydroxybutyrate depolymerase
MLGCRIGSEELFMRFFLLLILFLFTINVFAQTEEEFQTLEERGYGIYIPSGYDGSEDLPLVLALHGFGDEWHNFSRASGWMTIAEEYNFIVAFPNGYLRQWNDGGRGDHYEDDVWMLQVMIERVAQDYRINRERIYLAGFSNGGTMVYKVACEAPTVFAAIASVGGTMRYNQDCPATAQLSVMIIHGTGDAVVPFTGGDGRYSAPESARFWTFQNNCETEGIPYYDSSHFVNRIASYDYENCDGGHQVKFYVIEDFPHSWPGALEYNYGVAPHPTMDAPRLIWEFFEASYLSEQAASAESTPEATESND